MLMIDQVTKSFGDHLVLDNIHFKVEEGSIFGLVGINGAGKSTMLRCIAGIVEPDGGQILLDDVDVLKNPEIRKEILYVSDDSYYPFASSIQSMKTFYESFYSFDLDAYHHYLKVFGLDERKQISSFSKGMKRQVSLLFALSIKPKLLLLDEAFDGLDPLTRLKAKRALVDLLDEKECTVIISSHNLKELEDICDTFGILENGHTDLGGNLQESKDQVHKYQLAFDQEKSEEDFKDFEVMHFQNTGRVVSLVIKGQKDEIKEKLKEMDPLLLDELPVNFEELFIYELESRGYDDSVL